MGRKLLVVDDDSFFRKMLVEILQTQGYEVIEARDGEEGIARFKENHPDLVITDIRMPRKTGFQLGEEILILAPGTPIIFISGWFDPNRDTTGMSFAMEKKKFPTLRFLKKPFRISELLSQIEEILCAGHADAA